MEKNKRGRPVKEQDSNKRTYIFKVRLNEDEQGMLTYIMERTGKSASEIARKAIKASYNLERFKE